MTDDKNAEQPEQLKKNEAGKVTRREFIQSAAAAAAAGMLLSCAGKDEQDQNQKTSKVPAEPKKAAEDAETGETAEVIEADAEPIEDEGPVTEIPIAIIGAGSQGRNLLKNCLKIRGIRFRAICDVWPYSLRYSKNILRAYKQQVNPYDDYREMLAKERDLAAVIVATPDWVHAEHTNACLEAGLHVYCEKEMSNTLAGAASMVRTARSTGKLLQIGHQRRSNPRYFLAKKLIEKDRVLGRITHVYGQWNRRQQLDLGWPKKELIGPAELRRHGYKTMEQFRNWRWFRKYSGGPLADLGSHQIDIFSWFLHANPISVMASGGIDYYKSKGRDWYDNAIAIYEYDTTQNGVQQRVRGSYQVFNTTSHGGFYETFMGDEGTIVVSEDINKGFFFREPTTKPQEWMDEATKVESGGVEAIKLIVGESLKQKGANDPKARKLLADVKKDLHQLHLENFFTAVRADKRELLNCPAEVGYETAVAVLTANEAMDARKTIDIKPESYRI